MFKITKENIKESVHTIETDLSLLLQFYNNNEITISKQGELNIQFSLESIARLKDTIKILDDEIKIQKTSLKNLIK